MAETSPVLGTRGSGKTRRRSFQSYQREDIAMRSTAFGITSWGFSRPIMLECPITAGDVYLLPVGVCADCLGSSRGCRAGS